MAVKMKWISDIDRTVLVSNFERLGWVRGTTEGHECELSTSCFNIRILSCLHTKVQREAVDVLYPRSCI